MAVLTSGRPAQCLMAMFQGSGNIPPILAIASRLVARGHHVRIIAGPGLQPDRSPRPVSAAFLEGVKRAGATLIPLQQAQGPCAGVPPARGLYAGWTPPPFATNVFLARRFLAAPIWAANVIAELARQPADVVVADFYLLGALAATQAAGVPSAALVHHPHIRPTPGVPPFGPGWLPAHGPGGWLRDAIGRAIVERLYWRDGLAPVNQARHWLGLPPLQSPLAQYDAAARVLIMTSPAFDFRPRAVPPNVRYVGMPFEDVNAAMWVSPWPADDARPLVLISFSTAPQGQAGALQHTLTALSTLPVRDLDVALYTTEEKDCLFAADIAARLRRETGFEVDVTVMNHTPVALQFAILRDGLLLFSNDEALRTALIERVSRQYREYAHFRDLFLGVAGARPQQDR